MSSSWAGDWCCSALLTKMGCGARHAHCRARDILPAPRGTRVAQCLALIIGEGPGTAHTGQRGAASAPRARWAWKALWMAICICHIAIRARLARGRQLETATKRAEAAQSAPDACGSALRALVPASIAHCTHFHLWLGCMAAWVAWNRCHCLGAACGACWASFALICSAQVGQARISASITW